MKTRSRSIRSSALILTAMLLAACDAGAGGTGLPESGTSAEAAEVAPAIPASPVGEQLGWVLAQLNGDASTLEEEAVGDRFSPEFLQLAIPADGVVELLRQTALERGPFELTGFLRPPTDTSVAALLESAAGERGAVSMSVDAAAPHRITTLEMDEAPPAPLAESGQYAGRFDIGGRHVFLSCVGTGAPTVVLEGGVSSDWMRVQEPVASLTRVCSYDRANAPLSRSDAAPTPRTGEDVIGDLHAVLEAAAVPGPYILVGHSDGGLFVQLYATHYPNEVSGLVLIDSVHEDQEVRRLALLEPLLPPEEWELLNVSLTTLLPVILNPQQFDYETIFAQMRAARLDSTLPAVPLFVLTHGRAADAAGYPAGWSAEAEEQLWRELQAELANLVPDSRHVVAEASGHDIHNEQPDLVADAIGAVVEAVRDPATWKQDGE